MNLVKPEPEHQSRTSPALPEWWGSSSLPHTSPHKISQFQRVPRSTPGETNRPCKGSFETNEDGKNAHRLNRAPLMVLLVWSLCAVCAAWGPSPLGAEPGVQIWTDQLVHQVQQQRDRTTHPAVREGYERYLQDLQRMRDADAAGDEDAVRAGVVRLIRMLALRDNMISESFAHKLLQSIAMSVPVHLLDLDAAMEAKLLRIRDEMDTSPRHESSHGGSGATATADDAWRSQWEREAMALEIFAILAVAGVGVILFVSSIRVARMRETSFVPTRAGHADAGGGPSRASARAHPHQAVQPGMASCAACHQAEAQHEQVA